MEIAKVYSAYNVDSYDVAVLNELIELVLDSCKGYVLAAERSKNAVMADMFRRRASDRRRILCSLRQMVRSLGGHPPFDGTLLGFAHRRFMEVRARISSTHRAIVDEMERSECYIEQKFEQALHDGDLSKIVQNVVQDAYISVKVNHDEMRELKRAFH